MTHLFKRVLVLAFISTICYSCFNDAEDGIRFMPSVLSATDADNPNPFNGPEAPLEDMPYAEIPGDTYTIELERWDIPNNRTQPEKTTNNLQSAIDWAVDEGYGKIYLPKGHYLIGKAGNDIYYAGLELASTMAFLLSADAVIEMVPNDKWNYCAISIKNKAHVVVSGGTILGDRDNHTYTPRISDGSIVHDEGHLICIEGESTSVTISNTVLGKANGDGILIVGSGVNEAQNLRDITIRRNNFSDNRRQGISIVGGKDIVIENNEIHHTNGTAPQFGIDLEGAGRINENINIVNNYFHHNTGGDIVNTDGQHVLVANNILTQGEDNTYIDGPMVYWKNADWTVRHNTITMLTPSANNWNGIIMYSNDAEKVNSNTSYIYDNTLYNCGMYMYKGADLVIRNNLMQNGHLAFKEMTNLALENNNVTHENRCWAYRFLDVSGTATGNTYNDAPFSIPLQQNTPWDGCWID